MIIENEVTLRVNVIFNICWEGQLSQKDAIKETFYLNVFIGKKIKPDKQKYQVNKINYEFSAFFSNLQELL